MADDTTPTTSTPRKRSPNFPGISLSKAVDRAREVYAQAQHHPVPITSVTVKYWGYTSPNTGPASVTYAALKRYGLLDEDGSGDSRVAHLTPLAVKILHVNPEQDDAIRTAALNSEIIREWWDKYGADLPPDDTLHWEYVVNGPFAEEGLVTFLRVYRETLVYAKLTKQSTVNREKPDSNGGSDGDVHHEDNGAGDDELARQAEVERRAEQERQRKREQQRRGHGVLTIPVPMQDSDPVIVEFPGKLTEEDWDYFLTTLAAMKRGVVRRPAEADTAKPEAD